MNIKNRYDKHFTFEMAQKSHSDEIMNFIKTHWDKNHILANDRDFFNYHFGNLDSSDNLNIFVMREKNGKIAGILGHVIYGTDELGVYFSGSITKVRTDISVPMAGLELQKRLYQYFDKFIEMACGANSKTIVPLFTKVFKYQSGIMDLYYLPNDLIHDYKLIKAPYAHCATSTSTPYALEQVKTLDSLEFNFCKRYEKLPFKSKKFLEHRYFRHPVYEYLSYAIKDSHRCLGIAFFRLVEHKGARILMFVDFVGNLSCLAHIGAGLRDLLYQFNAECVHLLTTGLDQDVLNEVGFLKVDLDSDKVIIPTYFEPFLNANIKNYYIKNRTEMVIFKALGDQDNPKYKGVSL